MRIFCGLLLGGGWAVADLLLLRFITRAAERAPERATSFLTRGLMARYLLTIAVLAVGLLLTNLFDPLWVVLPLIVQKAVIVVAALLKKD